MRYDRIVTGTFVSRPNRFIAYCDIDVIRTKVHMKNTCRSCNNLMTDSAVLKYALKGDYNTIN